MRAVARAAAGVSTTCAAAGCWAAHREKIEKGERKCRVDRALPLDIEQLSLAAEQSNLCGKPVDLLDDWKQKRCPCSRVVVREIPEVSQRYIMLVDDNESEVTVIVRGMVNMQNYLATINCLQVIEQFLCFRAIALLMLSFT